MRYGILDGGKHLKGLLYRLGIGHPVGYTATRIAGVFIGHGSAGTVWHDAPGGIHLLYTHYIRLPVDILWLRGLRDHYDTCSRISIYFYAHHAVTVRQWPGALDYRIAYKFIIAQPGQHFGSTAAGHPGGVVVKICDKPYYCVYIGSRQHHHSLGVAELAPFTFAGENLDAFLFTLQQPAVYLPPGEGAERENQKEEV